MLALFRIQSCNLGARNNRAGVIRDAPDDIARPGLRAKYSCRSQNEEQGSDARQEFSISFTYHFAAMTVNCPDNEMHLFRSSLTRDRLYFTATIEICSSVG